MGTSKSNDALSEILAGDMFGTDENSKGDRDQGYLPVNLKTKDGSTKVGAAVVWVAGPPTIGYSNEMPTYEWTLQASHMAIFAGGISSDPSLLRLLLP